MTEMQHLRRYLEKNTESQAFQACSWLESLRTSRPTQTAPSAAATSRSRLTAGCTHTPCGRVIASSLRLSHTAAALWSLRSSHQSNAQSRLREQLASLGEARATRCCGRNARVCVVCVLFQVRTVENCRQFPRIRMRGLRSFPSKDKSKSQTLTLHGDSSEKTPKHKTPNPQNEPRAHPDGQYLMSNHS